MRGGINANSLPTLKPPFKVKKKRGHSSRQDTGYICIRRAIHTSTNQKLSLLHLSRTIPQSSFNQPMMTTAFSEGLFRRLTPQPYMLYMFFISHKQNVHLIYFSMSPLHSSIPRTRNIISMSFALTDSCEENKRNAKSSCGF